MLVVKKQNFSFISLTLYNFPKRSNFYPRECSRRQTPHACPYHVERNITISEIRADKTSPQERFLDVRSNRRISLKSVSSWDSQVWLGPRSTLAINKASYSLFFCGWNQSKKKREKSITAIDFRHHTHTLRHPAVTHSFYWHRVGKFDLGNTFRGVPMISMSTGKGWKCPLSFFYWFFGTSIPNIALWLVPIFPIGFPLAGTVPTSIDRDWWAVPGIN